jgi:hypothetical protein
MSSLRRILAAVFTLAGAASTVAAVTFLRSDPVRDPLVMPRVHELESGWDLRPTRDFPEEISSLAGEPPDENGVFLYVGTTPTGSVYRFSMVPRGGPDGVLPIMPVAVGMGDAIQFGTCCVNHLAIRDLDYDGAPELLATTCQIQPRGRPRLYIWSLRQPGPPVLKCLARPEIQSSWSHGLGFFEPEGGGPPSIFSTFCGHGEIVEYRFHQGEAEPGFRQENLTWKVAGQLPASGESTQTVDVDNDGSDELCLAAGFAEGNSAVHVYHIDPKDATLRLKHRVDEGGRFGNVRFLVGDLQGDGAQEMIAWWCTGQADGHCEVIRYRLAPEGVCERTVVGHGTADDLWPRDGQMALIDLDGDGKAEVWNAAGSGNLWRYEPLGGGWRRVLRVEGGIGPILAREAEGRLPARLYISSGKVLMELAAAPQ